MLVRNLIAGEDAGLLLRDKKTLPSFILSRPTIYGPGFSWGGGTSRS